MEFIEHECGLVDALNTSGIPCDERPILDPYMFTERLHFMYGQMADITLQYSKHTFTKIGCITSIGEGGSWVVSHRPLTLNMNELVQLGNVSLDILPHGRLETAAIKRGILQEDQRLSPFIHHSWKTGDFWVSYAARRCWAFDMIYWAKIDTRFFGDGTVNDRLELLTLEEREELDQLVNRITKAEHGTTETSIQKSGEFCENE